MYVSIPSVKALITVAQLLHRLFKHVFDMVDRGNPFLSGKLAFYSTFPHTPFIWLPIFINNFLCDNTLSMLIHQNGRLSLHMCVSCLVKVRLRKCTMGLLPYLIRGDVKLIDLCSRTQQFPYTMLAHLESLRRLFEWLTVIVSPVCDNVWQYCHAFTVF